EQTRVNDNDGRLKFFLSVLKEPNSPLIFYLQNCQERAGALFSDVGLSYFADPVSSSQLLRQIFERLSMEVLESDVSLDEIAAPTLTAGYFYFDKQTTFPILKNQIACRGKFETPGITLDFKDLGTSTEQKGPVKTAAKDYLPIYLSLLDSVYERCDFDYDAYFSNLRTKVLGKSVLFVQTITSTNPVCNR
uniref:Uncharacterized protein n=1 Tax=Romanomermis culicivorax TaxID=13658 RepID=A0A915I6V9_ROMCU